MKSNMKGRQGNGPWKIKKSKNRQGCSWGNQEI